MISCREGQKLLPVAPDKLHPRQRGRARGAAVGTVLPPERHAVLRQPGDAGVADGQRTELPHVMAPTGPDTKAWGKRRKERSPRFGSKIFEALKGRDTSRVTGKAVPPLQGLHRRRANSRGAAPGFVVWPLQGRFCYRIRCSTGQRGWLFPGPSDRSPPNIIPAGSSP